MDFREIDVPSYAARAAHVAAMEVFGLVTFGEPRPVLGWYVGQGRQASAEQAEADIDTMAAYVIRRVPFAGETLFLHNTIHGRAMGAWDAQAPAVHLAYDVFVTTCRYVSGKLVGLQLAAEQAAAERRRPASAQIDIEDTIFASLGSLAELRPEAIEAERLAQDRQEPDQVQDPAELDQARAFLLALIAGRAHQAPAAPLSIGEAPPAPPVNRGGRGNRRERRREAAASA